MFKNFQQFNEQQSKVLQPKSVFALRDAIATQSQLLANLSRITSTYTRAYNSVQVIKYNDQGDPVDVTPENQLTVPENVLAYARATIDQVREQLDEYRDIVADLTQSISVTQSEWYRDLESNWYSIGGHRIMGSSVAADASISVLKYLPLVVASSAPYQIQLGHLESGVARPFIGTLPDRIGFNGADLYCFWKCGDMLCVYSDSSFDLNDAVFAIYWRGKARYYQIDGTFSSKVDSDIDGNTPWNVILANQTPFNIDTVVNSYHVITNSLGNGGATIEPTDTLFKPTINEDYQTSVKAILVNNIIVPDRNLVDLKETLN